MTKAQIKMLEAAMKKSGQTMLLLKDAKKGMRIKHQFRVVELTADAQPTHRGYYLAPFTVVEGAPWVESEMGSAATINAHGTFSMERV